MTAVQRGAMMTMIFAALRDAGLPLVTILDKPPVGLHVRPPYDNRWAPWRVRVRALEGTRYTRADRATEDRLLVAAGRALRDAGLVAEDDHNGTLHVSLGEVTS